MRFNRDQQKLMALYESVYSIIKEEDDKHKKGEAGMSPKLQDAFYTKLHKAKDVVLALDPYAYGILNQLTVKPTFTVETMAVNLNKQIFINPRYMLEELSVYQTAAVLIHETMHYSLNSFHRMGIRDLELWNIATDYFINMYIHRDFQHIRVRLPKGVMMPSKVGDRYIIKKYKNLNINGIDTSNGLDITNLTAEALYEIFETLRERGEKTEELKEDEEKQKKVSQHNPKPKGQPKPLEVGKVIRDTKTGEYGIVTSIDEKTGEFTYKEISKKEAYEKAKNANPRVNY